MRFNFLILVFMFVALGAQQILLQHDIWLGAAMWVMAVVMFFVHRRRVRKFKEYDRNLKEHDQSRTFD